MRSKYDVTTDNWKLHTAELGATLERWRTADCGTAAKIFNIWVQQRNYAERERERGARCAEKMEIIRQCDALVPGRGSLSQNVHNCTTPLCCGVIRPLFNCLQGTLAHTPSQHLSHLPAVGRQYEKRFINVVMCYVWCILVPGPGICMWPY